MDAGRCRTCGRAFSPGEVVGVGILRARPASAGGPYVEFRCPECATVNLLVPHGQSRFAPPGAPPPPPPSDDERRLPWMRSAASAGEDAGMSSGDGSRNGHGPARDPATSRSAAHAPPAPSTPSTPKRVPPPPPMEQPGSRDDMPVDELQALAVLGLAAGASDDEIEATFRRLSLGCHPDKVAHLDADFLALAERKFRRLTAARDLLLDS